MSAINPKAHTRLFNVTYIYCIQYIIIRIFISHLKILFRKLKQFSKVELIDCSSYKGGRSRKIIEEEGGIVAGSRRVSQKHR